MAIRLNTTFTASGQVVETTQPVQGGGLLEVGGSAVIAGGVTPISTGTFDLFIRSKDQADTKWKPAGTYSWPCVVTIPATFINTHVKLRSTAFTAGSGSSADIVLNDLAAS